MPMPSTALVTGATAGFGAEICRRLSRDGVRVIAAGRRTERLLSLQAELGGPERCHVVTLDVRDRAATEALVASLPAAWQAIDLCVNNAGLALGLEMADAASLDDWETMVDTNCKVCPRRRCLRNGLTTSTQPQGLMFVTRAVLPGMKLRNCGHVVNIGSTAAEWPYPGANVYGASKAFVRQFSLNLRADLLGSLVRVTDIEPGMCSGTEFSNVRFRGDDAKAAAVYANTLTPSLGAEDVADAVAWVASRPAHVNINLMQLMPVSQAFGPLAVKRV